MAGHRNDALGDGPVAGAVADRRFTQVRRGCDPEEVRRFVADVAGQLERQQARIDELVAQLAAATDRPANLVMSEEAVVAAVGDDVAAVLRSAHAAAHELRTRAAEEADRVTGEARARATSLEEEVDDRLAAAAAGIAARRSACSAEAEAMTTGARSEAAAIVLTARRDAEAEATEVLARARAEAEAVARQAEQERRLTVAGAQAIRDRILGDLARRRRVATVQIEQLRAGRERLLESYGVVRRTLEEVHDELQRADVEARRAADEVGRRLAPAPQAAAGPDPARGTHPLSSVEPVAATGPVADAAPEAAPAPGAAMGPVADAAPEADPVAVADPAPGRLGEGTARSDADEVELQRRDAELVELEAGLTRRWKRALQDEHNDLLDGLRNGKGAPRISTALPAEAAQVDRYSAVGRPFVERAATCGVRSALREGDGQDGPPPATGSDGGVLVDEVAAPAVEAAAEALVGPLRRRVGEVLSERGDDAPDDLAEALASVYREVRSHRVTPLAADVLSAAYARATWRAAPERSVLRWVADDAGGPCPDCDDNVLAGGVTKGEPFPTGQLHPPAHAGCHCVLVVGGRRPAGVVTGGAPGSVRARSRLER